MRLVEANSRQAEPPLAEVEKLLSTLLEGWESAAAQLSSEQTLSGSTAPEYEPISCAY